MGSWAQLGQLTSAPHGVSWAYWYVCTQSVSRAACGPAGPGWPHTSWASGRMSGMAGPLSLHGLSLFFSLSTGSLVFREASLGLFQGVEVQERESRSLSKGSWSRGLEITQNHVCPLLLIKASHQASPDSGSGRNRFHCFMEGAVKKCMAIYNMS